VFGGLLGLLPGILSVFVFYTHAKPSELGFQAVLVGFVTAGGLLGAVAGAARRRGARTDFGVYPSPGIGPAVEVPAFKGPRMRFSAAQLRRMADLLDRHRQSFQLRPLDGRPTESGHLPADTAGDLTADWLRPPTSR
jgi:hypothetical protein